MEASWLFNDLFILKPACYFQNAIETKSTRQQQNESKRKHRICSEKNAVRTGDESKYFDEIFKIFKVFNVNSTRLVDKQK